MSRWRHVVSALLVGTVTVAGCQPAPQAPAPAAVQSGSSPSDARPLLQTGIQSHVLWSEIDDADRLRTLDLVAETGVEWIRLDLGWCTLFADGPGAVSQWYLDRADIVVDASRERGLEVLMTLWCTPEWASEAGREESRPTDVGEYAAAAEFAAGHFAGRVAAWEVWNEPNHERFWADTDPATYTELLRAAYPALKRGDPDALVVFGGTSFNDAEWIDQAYQAGAAGFFDVMATHPYIGMSDSPPTSTAGLTGQTFRGVEEVRAVMQEHGDASPIWFTEFGWSSHANDEDTPGYARGVSAVVQGEYLQTALDLVTESYPYVTNMFWYKDRSQAADGSHEEGFGLVTESFVTTPAYDALQDYNGR